MDAWKYGKWWILFWAYFGSGGNGVKKFVVDRDFVDDKEIVVMLRL